MDEHRPNHNPANGRPHSTGARSGEPPEESAPDTIPPSDLTVLDVRSEEVQEIIGRPPHWLVRFGITGFFAVLALVLLSAWVISYPEAIEAPIRLTAVNAPVTLQARISGKLVRLLAENNSQAEQGQVLAWLQSTADHRQVLDLSEDIDTLQAWLSAGEFGSIRAFSLPGYSRLGELQGSFQSFEASWRELRSFLEGGIYLRQREMLGRELALMRRQLELLGEQKQIQEQDYERAQTEFEGQQRLADQGLVAPIEIARAESELAARRLPLQQTESAILSNESSQAAKQTEIMEMERRIAEQQSVFAQALAGLRSAVDAWTADYLLMAPLDGRVIHAGIIQEGQSLQAGENVLYVRPEDTDYFGQLEIGQESVGKIRPGQTVLVRLSGYPYHEYGSLEGRIDYLSEFPMGEGVFLGKVSFPDGFVTSYGRPVQPRGGMSGQAEIITEPMRLIERVYNNMTRELR